MPDVATEALQTSENVQFQRCPDPTPLGAPALRASLGIFGPSIVVPPPLMKILATRLLTTTKKVTTYSQNTV